MRGDVEVAREFPMDAPLALFQMSLSSIRSPLLSVYHMLTPCWESTRLEQEELGPTSSDILYNSKILSVSVIFPSF